MYDDEFSYEPGRLENANKEDQELWDECKEELRLHDEQRRKMREEDKRKGEAGCNYVDPDEFCVRKDDGRVYKYRYTPTRPWSCGDASKDDFVFPEPVDRVDPDYFDKIAKELDQRDLEALARREELREEENRKLAEEEALSWYNGSKRVEYDNDFPLWWRLLDPDMKERERAKWCTIDSNSTSHWRAPEEKVDPLPTDLSEYGQCQGLKLPWAPKDEDPVQDPDVERCEAELFGVDNEAARKRAQFIEDHTNRLMEDLHEIERNKPANRTPYVWNELGEELRSCALRGKWKYMQELIDCGADPNYLSSCFPSRPLSLDLPSRSVYAGWRPIHYAAFNDHDKAIQILLDNGAAIDMTNDFGQTPLHLAAAKASNKAITMLLKYGADTSRRHVEGLLPVELEVAHKRMHMAEFPTSQRLKTAVLLLAAATEDSEAARDAYEDAKDWWTPPDGFAN
ncbi:hypothetical protein GUITHDRAFT_115244 [Guillardia theta CCMP2712]|uniref:Uncharacterized protein n=1 Tax=Guillardia theta (strain CCMP2712) TaxID=905079 RepID=L1IQY4_GUITC|nr:hypothetical protein GUITHDRAFT_115244 [Guillardia theta CCMP2712]EKX38696.1 hypothetical protein GUITHDRAFT_115244 [Guillardia theta CCMP2712]|eukprot:XP_005825676.1 hypothetical protein GUITHDRAFT_115244 [Guillardia theta CCMP2712]